MQSGLNIGLHRPNYSSLLSDYIRQAELPKGYKVPKFTKFAGETNESAVKYIARFEIEVGDIFNDEGLKMRYFPSLLTKNVFTWFTPLAPNTIQTREQLERFFHEQFYMVQSKISLKELSTVKQRPDESIDDYLNIFRILNLGVLLESLNTT